MAVQVIFADSESSQKTEKIARDPPRRPSIYAAANRA